MPSSQSRPPRVSRAKMSRQAKAQVTRSLTRGGGNGVGGGGGGIVTSMRRRQLASLVVRGALLLGVAAVSFYVGLGGYSSVPSHDHSADAPSPVNSIAKITTAQPADCADVHAVCNARFAAKDRRILQLQEELAAAEAKLEELKARQPAGAVPTGAHQEEEAPAKKKKYLTCGRAPVVTASHGRGMICSTPYSHTLTCEELPFCMLCAGTCERAAASITN